MAVILLRHGRVLCALCVVQAAFNEFLATAQLPVVDIALSDTGVPNDPVSAFLHRMAARMNPRGHKQQVSTTASATLDNSFSVGDENVDETGAVLGISLKDKLNLSMFSERLDELQELQAEITELSHSVDVGFLRINSQPIKQALVTWVTKWIYAYTSFLGDYGTGRLQWLHQFMSESDDDMQLGFDSRTTGQDLDRDTLIIVMSRVRSIKDMQDVVRSMIDSTVETVDLCRAHGYILPVRWSPCLLSSRMAVSCRCCRGMLFPMVLLPVGCCDWVRNCAGLPGVRCPEVGCDHYQELQSARVYLQAAVCNGGGDPIRLAAVSPSSASVPG